jgi:hypothetical protein
MTEIVNKMDQREVEIGSLKRSHWFVVDDMVGCVTGKSYPAHGDGKPVINTTWWDENGNVYEQSFPSTSVVIPSDVQIVIMGVTENEEK